MLLKGGLLVSFRGIPMVDNILSSLRIVDFAEVELTISISGNHK